MVPMGIHIVRVFRSGDQQGRKCRINPDMRQKLRMTVNELRTSLRYISIGKRPAFALQNGHFTPTNPCLWASVLSG